MRTLAFLLLLLWSEKHSLMIQRYKMLSSRLDESFLMEIISVWDFDEQKNWYFEIIGNDRQVQHHHTDHQCIF